MYYYLEHNKTLKHNQLSGVRSTRKLIQIHNTPNLFVFFFIFCAFPFFPYVKGKHGKTPKKIILTSKQYPLAGQNTQRPGG